MESWLRVRHSLLPYLYTAAQEFREIIEKAKHEIHKVIVGQHELVDLTLQCIFCHNHALLMGVPGLAKTLMARSFAQVTDLEFARVQFTPDLMPADITGTDIMQETEEGRREFVFQRGPIFANLILADEVNRATPKTQSALLEAMQEKSVTVANRTYQLEPPFFVLATQNPLEMEGTYPLPEAQLDRFLFKVEVRFPSAQELVTILDRTTGADVPAAQIAANGQRIIQMGQLALQTPIASHVSDYVARLVVATHPDSDTAPEKVRQYVRYGASPRGAQALILGAKITALLSGRYNVAFEDVRAVAPAALRAMEYLQKGARRSLDEVLAAMDAFEGDEQVGAGRVAGQLGGELEHKARALAGNLAETRVGHFRELAGRSRAYPGRPGGLVVDQAHFAEELALVEVGQHHFVAVLILDHDLNRPVHDVIQDIGQVAGVDHDGLGGDSPYAAITQEAVNRRHIAQGLRSGLHLWVLNAQAPLF